MGHIFKPHLNVGAEHEKYFLELNVIKHRIRNPFPALAQIEMVSFLGLECVMSINLTFYRMLQFIMRNHLIIPGPNLI